MLGTIIFFAIFIALAAPSIIWGVNCYTDRKLYKPTKGQFTSIMLWVLFFIVIIWGGIWQLFVFLCGFALVAWIGVKLFIKFVEFLWK
jgi:hypothetical protein